VQYEAGAGEVVSALGGAENCQNAEAKEKHMKLKSQITPALAALMACVSLCCNHSVETSPRGPGGVEGGFRRLFNGKDLSGWKGNPRIWSVDNGVITGQTTAETRICENDFLIRTGGDVTDFELRLKFRLENGNSGIYFRSAERSNMHPEPLVGPQADFSADGRWTGVVMEYTKRDILAERGQKVVISKKGQKRVVGSVGDSAGLLKAVKDKQWNDYTVIARGGHILLKINDVVMCEIEDNDPRRVPTGRLALQVHVGPPMLVQFKDIRLREF
jgi:hypothetical protein